MSELLTGILVVIVGACVSPPGDISDAQMADGSSTQTALLGAQQSNEATSPTPVIPNPVVYPPTGVIIGDEPPGVATGMPVTTPSGGNEAQSPNVAPSPNAPATPNQPASPNAISSSGNAPCSTSACIWPNIAFNDYNGKLGAHVVALTFDDGPDGQSTNQNNTGAVLDFLRQNNLNATFFVCGDVWTQVATDPLAQATIKRILAEGHEIGTHTFTHPHLDAVTPTALAQQFSDNLTMARNIFGQTFSFSMYRAPFGFPFQTNNPNVPWVAPIVVPNGVHVGWGIDTDDWKCAQDGQSSNCILNNLDSQLKAGRSGPILMHAVYQLTVKTLPAILSMIRSYGYTIATAGDMIRDRYGADSNTVLKNQQAQSFTTTQVGQAAVTECNKNHAIVVPY